MKGSKVASVNPETKALRGRKLYIEIRRAKVREEIKNLFEVRKGLTQKAQSVSSLKPDELRQLHQDQTYTSHDMTRLKSELQALEAEWETVRNGLKSLAA